MKIAADEHEYDKSTGKCTHTLLCVMRASSLPVIRLAWKDSVAQCVNMLRAVMSRNMNTENMREVLITHIPEYICMPMDLSQASTASVVQE